MHYVLKSNRNHHIDRKTKILEEHSNNCHITLKIWEPLQFQIIEKKKIKVNVWQIVGLESDWLDFKPVWRELVELNDFWKQQENKKED